MTAHSIFVELFSSFTLTYVSLRQTDNPRIIRFLIELVRRYAGILDAELQYLRAHIHEEVVYRQIPTWIQALEDGSLPRAATAVFSRVLTGFAMGGHAGYGLTW